MPTHSWRFVVPTIPAAIRPRVLVCPMAMNEIHIPPTQDTMARVDLIRLCSIVCFNLPSPSSLVNQFLPILQLLTKDQDARVFSAAVNALCHDRADPRLLWEKTRLLGVELCCCQCVCVCCPTASRGALCAFCISIFDLLSSIRECTC